MLHETTRTTDALGVDPTTTGTQLSAPEGTTGLDLAVTELEDLEAPGFWDTAAGVGAGAVVGYGVVWGAVAFT